MRENFNETELKEIISLMKSVEPAFKYWRKEKLINLTRAIYKCGYTWDDSCKDLGFLHPKNNLVLNFKGLHHYNPDSIIDTYENVWSKDSEENQIKKGYRVKYFKAFLTWISSFLLLFIMDNNTYASIFISILFIRFLYFFISYIKN